MPPKEKQCPVLIKERAITINLPRRQAPPGPAGGSPTSAQNRDGFYTDAFRIRSMKRTLKNFPESKMEGEIYRRCIKETEYAAAEIDETWAADADKNDLANNYLINNETITPTGRASALNQFVALAESTLAPYFNQKALTAHVLLQSTFKRYSVGVGESSNTQFSFQFIEHPAISYHPHPKPTLHVKQDSPTHFSIFANYIVEADILNHGNHTEESIILIEGIKLEFRVHIKFDTTTLEEKIEIAIYTDCRIPAVVDTLKIMANACYLFYPDKSGHEQAQAISILNEDEGKKQFLTAEARLLQYAKIERGVTLPSKEEAVLRQYIETELETKLKDPIIALLKYTDSWSGRRTYKQTVLLFLKSMYEEYNTPSLTSLFINLGATTNLIAWLIFAGKKPDAEPSASDAPRLVIEAELKTLKVFTIPSPKEPSNDKATQAITMRDKLHTIRNAIFTTKLEPLKAAAKKDKTFIMQSSPWRLDKWLESFLSNDETLNSFIVTQRQGLNVCRTLFTELVTPNTPTSDVHPTAILVNTAGARSEAGAGAGRPMPTH